MIVDPGEIDLLVTELYPAFGSAYAVDGSGQRYLLSADTTGIDFRNLLVGQKLCGKVNDRNYITEARYAQT